MQGGRRRGGGDRGHHCGGAVHHNRHCPLSLDDPPVAQRAREDNCRTTETLGMLDGQEAGAPHLPAVSCLMPVLARQQGGQLRGQGLQAMGL